MLWLGSGISVAQSAPTRTPLDADFRAQLHSLASKCDELRLSACAKRLGITGSNAIHAGSTCSFPPGQRSQIRGDGIRSGYQMVCKTDRLASSVRGRPL